MSRQSISFTDPNAEWLNQKVEIEGEYRSNSEAVNDLIRKAREIEGIRARLIQGEQSGFTSLTRDQIRAEIREEMQRNGEVPPKRKLAELEPLPPGETLPDVDEGLRPLDRDPLD